jgi:hypothetical protein
VPNAAISRGAITSPGAGKRIENSPVFLIAGERGDRSLDFTDRLPQHRQLPYPCRYHMFRGNKHSLVTGGRNRIPDIVEPLRNSVLAAAVLVKELLHCGGPGFAQILQRGPPGRRSQTSSVLTSSNQRGIWGKQTFGVSFSLLARAVRSSTSLRRFST